MMMATMKLEMQSSFIGNGIISLILYVCLKVYTPVTMMHRISMKRVMYIT